MAMKHCIILLTGVLLAGCAGKIKGPCDIYEKYGVKCVAAHSTTRKLYSKYDGPLYQVVRESDGKTLDIGTIDGVYANAVLQDAFLEGTIGYISIIYDQTGHGNDLIQASPGTFKGPAKVSRLSRQSNHRDFVRVKLGNTRDCATPEIRRGEQHSITRESEDRHSLLL